MSLKDKVKVTNSKNSQILEFCNNLYTRHTFSSWLTRCANMKWIRLLLWKIQSGHDFVHRRMDRRTDDVKSVYPPFNFVAAVGIIMREHCIGQTAWAAVIIMSWINMLRLEHYWGRVTHICLSKLTIIGSDNVLSPGRHQAIIRTNAGILLIGPLGTNFSEMLIKTNIFIEENTFESVVCEMAAILSRPQCVKASFFTFLLKFSLKFVPDGPIYMSSLASE